MEQNPFLPASKVLVTNLKYRKEAKKTKLLDSHMQTRLEFAVTYGNRTEEQWRKTVLVDEKVYSTHKDGRYVV